MVRVRAVIFDLDNVLYDEQEYIKAAYRNVAIFLSERCCFREEQIYQKLLDDFQKKTSLYPHLFDDLLTDLGLDKQLISDVLKIFSNATVNLELYPGAENLLNELKQQKIRLGLVTNGNVETQRNKVRLLGIEKYFDTILYARELGRENEKPDPEVYRIALQALKANPEEAICVGDNPHTDFIGAKKIGIRTVRLLRGEFKNVRLSAEYEADLEVRNFGELSKIIAKNN
ncbi:MAG: HAD-IA family hydrolase [Candidatus Bathyarchaeota archaeon]|nr:HAD-IA family hydrolase [Candidatus Bathyarchaeota archaeon]